MSPPRRRRRPRQLNQREVAVQPALPVPPATPTYTAPAPPPPPYAALLDLAARYLEFALYRDEARILRQLARAPIFCDDEAVEVIVRYSTLLEEGLEHESCVAHMNQLRAGALSELRGENAP